VKVVQKPWWCLPHDQDMIQHRLCRIAPSSNKQQATALYLLRSIIDIESRYGYCCYCSNKHTGLPTV